MPRSQGQEDYAFPDARSVLLFRMRLLRWFVVNGRNFPWRRSGASKYRIIIAEVLLQRTRAETVAAFFPAFVREFPSWRKLSTASIARLEHYLRPIGLWRRRATSIRALAKETAQRNGRFPKDRQGIESLPGVGQYIANAILLFCHGVRLPLVDVNMARVLERVFGARKLSDIRYDPYLQALARNVVQCKSPEGMNWAIMDLAASICLRRRPRCERCPVKDLCQFALQGGCSEISEEARGTGHSW